MIQSVHKKPKPCKEKVTGHSSVYGPQIQQMLLAHAKHLGSGFVFDVEVSTCFINMQTIHSLNKAY